MPKNWKTYKLSEVTEYIGRGISPKYTEDENSIKVINQRCIRDNKINFETCRNHDFDQKKVSDLKFVRQFDVLVNSTGVGTLGRVAQFKEASKNITVDSHVTIIRPQIKFANDFFGYAIIFNQPKIESMGIGSTGQTELSRSRLGEEIVLNIPKSEKEQKAIASILSAIDDKIENNLIINKTLEDMATALYKHWFVDFGPFKDEEFRDSELGLIPKGWEVKRMEELGNMYYGKMPKKDKIQTKGYPLYSGYKVVGYYPDYNCKKRKVIVVARGVGGTGDVKITKEDLFLTNISICIENNLDLLSDILLFYTLKSTGLHYLRTGSAQPQITINDLNGVSIIVPPKEIQFQFLDVFNNVIYMKDNNIEENQTLTQLRDILIPKLISGEMRLKEFREQLETVL